MEEEGWIVCFSVSVVDCSPSLGSRYRYPIRLE